MTAGPQLLQLLLARARRGEGGRTRERPAGAEGRGAKIVPRSATIGPTPLKIEWIFASAIAISLTDGGYS
jgi:hypothetical protein